MKTLMILFPMCLILGFAKAQTQPIPPPTNPAPTNISPPNFTPPVTPTNPNPQPPPPPSPTYTTSPSVPAPPYVDPIKTPTVTPNRKDTVKK